MTACLHFVGFRSLACQRLANAEAIFGPADFLHRRWDMRARREIANEDIVLFAKGSADQKPTVFNGDDDAYL